MLTRRVVIPPTVNLNRRIDGSGKLVRVVAGAWPTMRIFFRDPGGESSTLGVDGMPLINGECYFPKNADGFDSFWITGGTLQGVTGATAASNAQENLILEVYDCAQSVVVLNDGAGRGWRYHPIHLESASGLSLDPEDDPQIIHTDNTFVGSTTTLHNNPKLAHFMSRGFISGGLWADKSFTVIAVQHLDDGASNRVELARWTADQKPPTAGGLNWGYGISFDTAGAPGNDSAKVPTLISGGPIAYPFFGISLWLTCLSGTLTAYQLALFSRD